MARSKKTAPPAAPEPPAPAVAALTEATRAIDLNPEDYVWATWRPRAVLKRPEPDPFDFDTCRTRLTKLKKSTYNWIEWDDARVAPSITRREAHFWFLAMTEDAEKLTPAEIADKI